MVSKDGNSDNLIHPQEYTGPPAPTTPEPKSLRTARGLTTARGAEQAAAAAAARQAAAAAAAAIAAAEKPDIDRYPNGPDGVSVLVSKTKLKLRESYDLDSIECGELKMGTLVRILERHTLGDGTRRAHVGALLDNNPASKAPSQPLGWVTSVQKVGGAETLIERDDPVAIALLAHSPTRFFDRYRDRPRQTPRPRSPQEVVRPGSPTGGGGGLNSPGRDRAGTDSQPFVVRHPLKVRCEVEMDSPEIGTIAAGTQVRVLDRRELPDGTRRAKIGQHEERLNSPRRMGTPAPSAEEVLVLGWVSCAGKDGRENLIVEWRK